MSISSLPNSPARRNSCKRRSTSASCTSSGPISPKEDKDDSGGGCVAVVAMVAADRDRNALTEAVRFEWVVPALVCGGDVAADSGADAAVECLVPIPKCSATRSRFKIDVRHGLTDAVCFSC